MSELCVAFQGQGPMTGEVIPQRFMWGGVGGGGRFSGCGVRASRCEDESGAPWALCSLQGFGPNAAEPTGACGTAEEDSVAPGEVRLLLTSPSRCCMAWPRGGRQEGWSASRPTRGHWARVSGSLLLLTDQKGEAVVNPRCTSAVRAGVPTRRSPATRALAVPHPHFGAHVDQEFGDAKEGTTRGRRQRPPGHCTCRWGPQVQNPIVPCPLVYRMSNAVIRAPRGGRLLGSGTQPPPPPPLPALWAHLIAKGQQQVAMHTVAPKAPGNFFHSPCPFCPPCTPTLSLNPTLTLMPTPTLSLLLTLPPNLTLDPNPSPNPNQD